MSTAEIAEITLIIARFLVLKRLVSLELFIPFIPLFITIAQIITIAQNYYCAKKIPEIYLQGFFNQYSVSLHTSYKSSPIQTFTVGSGISPDRLSLAG